MNNESIFYRELVECSSVAVLVVGADAVIRYQSREAGRLLVGRDADLVGTLLPSLFTHQTQEHVDGWLRRVAARDADASTSIEAACDPASGLDERFIEMTAVNLAESPAIGGIVLNLVDHSELRRALALAERQAGFDQLTGLPNRPSLDERGRTLFSEGGTRQALLAMVDIDNLKAINDRYGHMAGDQVLQAVADRLTGVLGDVAMVARVGGDEFAVLLPETSPRTARALLRACVGITVPSLGESGAVIVSVSCGVASSTTAESWLGLIRCANVAVYEAKSFGKDRIYFYRGDELNWEERRRQERQALQIADRRVAALESDVLRLQDEVRHDKRTGLLNAAAFEQDLQALHQAATDCGEPYAIVLCDIDFFHRYNERYLFQPANATLRRVAGALKSACRSGDVVYRYGGEEMVVLLPRTQLTDAADIGERLRAAVADLHVPHENRPEPRIVTISVGVSDCSPGDGVAAPRVLDAANEALLVAKASGRNRVETTSRGG